MKMATEGYNKAFEFGSKAFLDGKRCVPAHDKEFMAWLYGQPGSTIQLLDAWLGGWTVENIRAE